MTELLDHSPEDSADAKIAPKPLWGLLRLMCVGLLLYSAIPNLFITISLVVDANLFMKLGSIVSHTGMLGTIAYQAAQGIRELKGLKDRYPILRVISILYCLLLLVLFFNGYTDMVAQRDPDDQYVLWYFVSSVLFIFLLYKDLQIFFGRIRQK